MKCQSCGKKEATVKYYENINGNTQKLYFCEDCANKLGISNFGDISDLFSPILATIPEFNLLEKKKCPVCGYTLEDYSNTGMLGCENCYNAFEKNLDDIFYKIHGKTRHIKLVESNKNKKVNENKEDKKDSNTKINELKEKLDRCIKEEKYEEAAVIRDKIKKIKKNG